MGEKEAREKPAAVEQDSGLQRTALRALSDEELAWRSQQGCEACFTELVRRYATRLFQFLRHKTNSVHDAEDLVQDTFVRAYSNIHRYRSSWKFSTWIFTIAARLASSHYRRFRRTQAVPEIQCSDSEPEQIIARREAQQSLWAEARGLTHNQYRVLRLKYAEDMSIKQIAKVMGKSQVAIKVLLYRARASLAEKLQNLAARERQTDRALSKKTLSFMKAEGA